ncbi:response regulator, partial [Methyloversatilis discipulorum]|uniref:response regulator n=1 Tax=Methyloversatilis discipulorum TaxID=1119528 RepID=UPI0026EB1E7E
MNAILGMLKLLQNTDLNARQLDYTSKTEGAAKSLLGLLNDILDFSKIDAGKMELDPQPFRVDRLLRDLSVILSANVGQKPVEILFDIDPAIPPTLVGDALRLQQVLINLSGNAIKFTEKGEVVLQLKVLAQNESHTTLQFSVRDSGIGIAPENQQHIFDGFSQAEASTTRRFGGTGLGLSISKRLVALMGGELALHSVLGQGSNFYFSIRLQVAPAQALQPEPVTERLPGPLRVLVVDDNPIARELLVAMARSWGWQVDAAASGEQALALVRARLDSAQPAYQAIFMDWQMPGLDGWQTIEGLRQLAPPTQTPAPITVMVTAHGREMLSERSAQEQARLNAFLVKPITASMLFDAVADAQAGHSNLRTRERTRTEQGARLDGLRLLVVEDNLINQQVAQELLGNEGAIVELADNGQLGVQAIARAQPPFDAVLMDLQMPVMDGYAATQAIRHGLGLTQLPVIAMTANAMASDREECLAAGMNDHVGKPFDLPHLIEVLLHYTGRARAPTPPSAGPAAPAERLQSDHARDVDAALARLGHNRALYLRILQSYLGEIATMAEQLDTLLHAGDLGGAGRLLHTLKGLSATVGASQMAELAKAAESQVKLADAGFAHDALRADLRQALARTTQLMGQVAQSLAPDVLARPRPADAVGANSRATTQPPNQAALLADLQELHDLLRNSDMQALDVHARLQAVHGGGAAGELEALDAALAAFDFVQG